MTLRVMGECAVCWGLLGGVGYLDRRVEHARVELLCGEAGLHQRIVVSLARRTADSDDTTTSPRSIPLRHQSSSSSQPPRDQAQQSQQPKTLRNPCPASPHQSWCCYPWGGSILTRTEPETSKSRTTIAPLRQVRAHSLLTASASPGWGPWPRW